MNDFVMTHRRLLGIDREIAFLEMLRNKISVSFPNCRFDAATTFEEGRQLMMMFHYDLVISDIMHPPGVSLMRLAKSRNLPVFAYCESGALSDTLRRCKGQNIMAVIPRENVGEMIPMIANVFRITYGPKWWSVLTKIIHLRKKTCNPTTGITSIM